MPLCVSYIRMSTDKQRFGDSLRRQLESARAYCDRNGLTLDESFRLADLGVSGFRGKNVREGALGAFLLAVESGKVPKGSVLIVESLDRLSREQISDALQLFLRIINAGVDIVTLQPERRHTSASVNDLGGILEPIVIMSRANEESETKSHRATSSWANKRKKSRDGTPMGGRCPWWLAYRDGAYHPIPDRVEVVRTLYRLRAQGVGYSTIQKRLNAGKVKPATSDVWSLGTLAHFTKTRTVLGEFQPGRYVEGKEVDEGDPVKGYYPQIIDETTYYEAQGRRVSRGRESSDGAVNLLRGIVFDAADGNPLHLITHRTKHTKKTYVQRYLVNSGRTAGVAGSAETSIRYEPFEAAFLKYVHELDPADFVSGGGDIAREVAETAGRIAELDHKIATLKTRIRTAKDIEPFLDLLSGFEGERKAFVASLGTLKAKQSNARVDAVGEVKGLASMLAGVSGDEATALRRKIRGRIAQLVERVALTVRYTDGGRKRGRGVRRKYTVLALVDFYQGMSRSFTCDNVGELVRGGMANELVQVVEVPDGMLDFPADLLGEAIEVVFEGFDEEDGV